MDMTASGVFAETRYAAPRRNAGVPDASIYG